MKKSIINILLCLIMPIAVGFTLMIAASLIMLNTNIGEGIESIFMLIISAITSILTSVMLVLRTRIKPYLCSVISFALVTLYKILITIVTVSLVTFSIKSIISLAFAFVFCFIGGMIGTNIKN